MHGFTNNAFMASVTLLFVKLNSLLFQLCLGHFTFGFQLETKVHKWEIE